MSDKTKQQKDNKQNKSEQPKELTSKQKQTLQKEMDKVFVSPQSEQAQQNEQAQQSDQASTPTKQAQQSDQAQQNEQVQEQTQSTTQDEDDDMFGFRPPQPTQTQGEAQHGNVAAANPKIARDKVLRGFLACLGVLVLAGVFLGGYFFGKNTAYLTEEGKVLDWALYTIEQNYIGDDVAGEVKSKEDYFNALFKVLGGDTSYLPLLDIYSTTYLNQELLNVYENMQGNFVDFGFDVYGKPFTSDMQATGLYQYLYVGAVHVGESEETQAQKAGVAVGDKLVAIDGVAIDLTDTTTFQQTYYGSLSNIQNNTATFTFQKREGETFTQEYQATLAYEDYVKSFVQYKTNKSAGYASLPNGTAYIAFTGFDGNASEQLVAAFTQYAKDGMQNLILDLRGNGGGYLSIAITACNYLVNSANMQDNYVFKSVFKDGSNYNLSFTSKQYQNFDFDDITVLIDGGSASASEVLLQAMIDTNSVNAIIGETSYGKGVMQSTFTHAYKEGTVAMQLTVAKWYSPSGVNVHGVGITPTQVQSANETNYPYQVMQDSALAAAITRLQTL